MAPPELVLLILSDVWETLQTPQERSAFVENAILVNRTWLALVAYVTSRDVHIHTAEEGMTFIRRLSKYPGPEPRELSNPFTAEQIRVTNAVCRSVTFHIHDSVSELYTPWPWPWGWGDIFPELIEYPTWPCAPTRMRHTVAVFLLAFGRPDEPYWGACLPRLRHVALRYTDWVGAYDDTFSHLERGAFPPQVTRLSIHHAFPDPTFRDAVCERWLRTRQGKNVRYAPQLCLCRRVWCRCGLDISRGMGWHDTSNVRHLALFGATAPLVVAALRACQGVETLELAFGEPRLDAIAPLPPAVRTVILRRPARRLGPGEQIWWWRLCQWLENGSLDFQFGVPHPGPGATGGRASGKDCDYDSGTESSAKRRRRRIVVRFGPAPDPMIFDVVRSECSGFGVELVHEPEEFCEPLVPG